MGEYETAYPDAYGRSEETEPRRRFFRLGLSRQVRDSDPPLEEAREDRPLVAHIDETTPAARSSATPRHAERPRRPLVERTPREICDDVAEQLNASPFIDASSIAIAVDGSEVTLDGTINSLIAISLAQALASNAPGVSRVQVRLRVAPAPRTYETAGTPIAKIVE